jgi:DNA-binding MarR family transcriptional regulator
MKLSALFIGFGLILSLFVFSGTLIYDSVDSTFISNDTGWEEETRVTDSKGPSYGPVVKEDGHGNAHIVWTDERAGTPQLYYAKYDGSGNVIVPETRLTKNGAPSGAPDMAVGPGGEVTIAFVDAREGNWNIFIKQLDSNGIEITPSTQVSQVPIGATAKSIIHNLGKGSDLDPTNGIEGPSIKDEEDRRVKQTAQTVTEYKEMSSFSPSIAIDQWGDIHIVWADSRTGNFELYYSLMDPQGNLEVSELLLTETASSSLRPLLALDPDGDLDIVWEEVRGDVTTIHFMRIGQSHIKLKEMKLVTTTTDSFSKAMDIDDDGVVHLVWADEKSGTRQVRYTAFNGKGMVAFEETTLTPPGGECFMPSVAVGHDLVHTVFVHGVGSSGQNIYYKTIDLASGNISQAQRLVPNAWGAKDLDLDWGSGDGMDGTLRLVWADSRDGEEDIFLSQAETTTTLSVENTVVVAGSETVSDPMTFAAVGGLFALGAVLATDVGRWAIGASFVPLYSRLKKERLLDQNVRDVIYRAIMEDPGVNFTGLMRSLCLKNGVLSYHLSTLEREDYIVSRRDGIYRRYYPKNNGCKAPKELHEQITDIVFERPGITQSKLARQLKKSRQVVNYHIKQMVANGTIRIIRKGRQTLCYVCNWVA